MSTIILNEHRTLAVTLLDEDHVEMSVLLLPSQLIELPLQGCMICRLKLSTKDFASLCRNFLSKLPPPFVDETVPDVE